MSSYTAWALKIGNFHQVSKCQNSIICSGVNKLMRLRHWRRFIVCIRNNKSIMFNCFIQHDVQQAYYKLYSYNIYFIKLLSVNQLIWGKYYPIIYNNYSSVNIVQDNIVFSIIVTNIDVTIILAPTTHNLVDIYIYVKYI